MAWTADSATIATASTSASQVSHGDRCIDPQGNAEYVESKAPDKARPPGDVSIHRYRRMPRD